LFGDENQMKYTIGIDVGTSGTKTVLFDQNGAKIASALMEYPMMQPKNGWAEQSPADWWTAAAGTIRQVVTDSAVNPADIVGVGLTGQMHGLVMLDEANNVLRPAIIWCDQRTAAECADIEAAVGHDDLIEITCNPALTGFTASKILWVRKNQPEIYAKCRHILLPKDYIRFMLTGNYATDVSDASGMQLLDIGGRCWSETVLKRLDIDPALLGTVYESPDVSGVITEEAAALTGLCAGTPVAAGAGDNAAAAVGVGVVKEGTAFTTIGGVNCGVLAICSASGGRLSAAAARKAARFVSFLDAFSMPLVTFVDSEGFSDDSTGQSVPIAAEFARLATAFALSDMPKITVIVGHAIGGSFTLLGSKALGADLAYAIDTAEIGTLSHKAAVAFAWNDRISEDTTRETLEENWLRSMSSPVAAASTGEIDDIINMDELRKRLCSGLLMLTCRADARRKHAVMPL
jgi:hypothetical protein